MADRLKPYSRNNKNKLKSCKHRMGRHQATPCVSSPFNSSKRSPYFIQIICGTSGRSSSANASGANIRQSRIFCFICRETAISFIGIIAEACMHDMGGDLQQSVLFLLQCTSGQSCALVRATSLWALEKLLSAFKDED
jgi:hypothetical protein